MEQLGILTYDTNHLKTEQVVLHLAGRYQLVIYGLPFTSRPSRPVYFQHRPNQSAAAHPRELCRRYNWDYIPVQSDAEIDNRCDLYLITGAGILSPACLRGKKILNCHPGIIPAARGLDAFKWSVYHMTPLGITLHYIDEAVDAGKIVSIIPTEVFPSDTLETLARRHYENEIHVLSHFEEHLHNPQNPFEGIPQGDATRRMKPAQEIELAHKFQVYKQAYCPSIEAQYVYKCPPPWTFPINLYKFAA